MSFKRPRTLSSSSSSQPDTSKSTRLAQAHAKLICTLPPTCNPPNNSPTPIASTNDLEIHYATFHAHVCEQPSCACVFPEQRLLELHQTECHDPIAALRKDRGEKIFACHLSACPRLFKTPKTRRLHLIQAHAFPKEFFFAVTNKGVGGLLKRWGEGASMIRGEWTPREGTQELEDDESGGEETPDEEMAEEEPTSKSNPQAFPTKSTPNPGSKSASTSLDALTSSMTSLSLVPPSIRFGRGGKNGGFVHRGGNPAHRSVIEHQHQHPHSADCPSHNAKPHDSNSRKTDTDPPDAQIMEIFESAEIRPVDERNDLPNESPSLSFPPVHGTKATVPAPAHRGRGRGHHGGVNPPRGRGRRFVPVRGGLPPGTGRGGSVVGGARMNVELPPAPPAVRGGRGVARRGVGRGVGRGGRRGGAARGLTS